MSNYQRLISYIYTYEGGIKGKNIGFVKMETRNVQCRITVNVKKIFVGGNPMGIYLLSNQGELQIGTLFARNGAGEFRTAVNAANIEDSGRGIEEFYGLSVHDVESAWRAYTTIWEDAVAHTAEVELAEVTSENLLKKQPENETAAVHNQVELPISKEIERELELEKKLDTKEKEEVHRREYWRRDGVSVRQSLVGASQPTPQRNVGSRLPAMELPQAELPCPGTPQPESLRPETPRSKPQYPEMPLSWTPQPEITRPVPPCPEIVQPGIVQPGIVQPEIVQPEIVQPEIVQPEIVQPEIVQPEIVQPGIVQPGMPQPEVQPHTPGPEFLQLPPAGEAAADENETNNHQEMWDYLRKKCAKMLAFDYSDGCEILRIKPQDIGLLPRDSWVYGNNSFLLHGYYNYRYLIMARLENPAGPPRYLLGIPGNYFSNEKYMAAMFGFPDFVLSKTQSVKDGHFGYWYSDIKIGD